MTRAEKAFAAAKERIAREKREGADRLDFANDEFAALEILPQEIGDLPDLWALALGDATAHVAVTDLIPLAALTGLRFLYLTSTPVTDLTPLAGLTGLLSLDLSDTPVTDLTPLAKLKALQSLYLRRAQVTDLTPLANLTGLQRLVLRVRPETLCRITEFSEHESNGRELDEGERVAVEVLPVLGQSAAAVEPGDGAFDHPTPGLDDEALHPIGSLDDLGLEIGQDAG